MAFLLPLLGSAAGAIGSGAAALGSGAAAALGSGAAAAGVGAAAGAAEGGLLAGLGQTLLSSGASAAAFTLVPQLLTPTPDPSQDPYAVGYTDPYAAGYADPYAGGYSDPYAAGGYGADPYSTGSYADPYAASSYPTSYAGTSSASTGLSNDQLQGLDFFTYQNLLLLCASCDSQGCNCNASLILDNCVKSINLIKNQTGF
ncbi:MAG: hypothetical protein JSR76_06185 [Verrucomicrobia bacterium]|nr:hypothetical protein [Verrucomicrobiota bacterium]